MVVEQNTGENGQRNDRYDGIAVKRMRQGLLKVIEKCTDFYFGAEKLPPKF